MLRVHTTKEKEKMFVSQMEDAHLRATINLYLNRIRTLKDALSMKVTVSPFKSALYGIDMNDLSEQAKEKISDSANLLYPYLAEAMLRGMDFKVELQEIFERTGAEAKFFIDDGFRSLGYDNDDDDE